MELTIFSSPHGGDRLSFVLVQGVPEKKWDLGTRLSVVGLKFIEGGTSRDPYMNYSPHSMETRRAVGNSFMFTRVS